MYKREQKEIFGDELDEPTALANSGLVEYEEDSCHADGGSCKQLDDLREENAAYKKLIKYIYQELQEIERTLYARS